MSDLTEKLDLSRYVPQNFPQLMAYKAGGCPVIAGRCPKVPCYTKDHFCAEWKNNFKCICPQSNRYYNPFQGVKEELACLDYFTRLPDKPPGRYPRLRNSPRFHSMAFKYGLDDINDCPPVQPSWSPICPDSQKVFNLIHKDAVCGLCVPPENACTLPVECPPNCSDQSAMTVEDLYDLPFRVKVGKFPQDLEPKKSMLPRTGVSRCLHPSSFRDLQTVQRDTYRDYYKMKTSKQLKYYRSPLAIDPRRPRLTIPSDQDKDLILSGPICVNALPLVMRPKGPQKLPRNLKPNFEVIVQGPICI